MSNRYLNCYVFGGNSGVIAEALRANRIRAYADFRNTQGKRKREREGEIKGVCVFLNRRSPKITL